ncbi:MAG: hypothetical protein IIB76_00335 [Proteobacteria bacterium]|nr:hypothetical protein [Pseudomonadota bacterium]
MTARTDPSRRQLLLVAALFVGPLLIASLMYYGNFSWLPDGRTNHGRLLEPIINLNEADGERLLSNLTSGETDNHWALLYVHSGECSDSCREALYRLRQSRLMLGSEMDRVKRIFLHGKIAPDTLFLEQQHRGLITISNHGLDKLLHMKQPRDLRAGGFYLVDPLGNLVLYFTPELAPRDMVDDIKHLLKLSRIG